MPDLVPHAAMAQDIGARPRQEDAILVHSCGASAPTLAVLSDGMGGHDDGDLASRMIIGEVFGELFLASARPRALRHSSGIVFDRALRAASERLRENAAAEHIGEDTGGTLICASVQDDQLRWLSVGDSLLYLWRGGRLRVLNEIHSFGAQLDRLVVQERLPADEARTHPDRSCLTSAVTGKPVPKVDRPDDAVDLEAGDVVILASDGIEALDRRTIAAILSRSGDLPPDGIASALLDGVKRLDAPDQDNVSVVVITLDPAAEPAPLTSRSLSAVLSGLLPFRRHQARAGRQSA